MRFHRGGLSFGSVTHVDGVTLRKRVKSAVVTYKRSKTVIIVPLTAMLPVRQGTITL